MNTDQVDIGSRRHEIMQTLMKAARPGASYKSAERADPPRCHPDTRKEVIYQIMNWFNSSDPEKRILWLSAAAGAGKSSIAQTIADKCAGEGKLLSSLFFSRTAVGSGRHDENRLVPTIAYHLAIAVPDARDLIVSEIQRDPAWFHHSMDVRLKTLVVNPIIRLVESEKIQIPFLVIIDGLDECNDIQVQSRIIPTIAKSVSKDTSHIRFFFTSRPEREIRKVFDLLSVDNHTKKLSLKEDEKAIRDITVYVKCEFNIIKNNHTLANELIDDHRWPSDDDIWTLVNRSSGNFIYASTAMKYIADDNEDPREALRIIIHRPMMNFPDENPLAELDAVYIHILSTAASRTKGGYNAFLSILQVLTLTTGEGILTSSGCLAEFLEVTRSALTLRMMHLHSVIDLHSVTHPQPTSHWSRYGPYPPPEPEIKFHHASFKDFLLDPSRSEKFYIDVVQGHKFLGIRCLAFLPRTSQVPSNATSKFKYITKPPMFYYTPRDPTTYAVKYLFVHIERSAFNVQLLNEFLHIVHVKSLISAMLNLMDSNATHQLLGSICSINFDHAGEFAVPKAAGAADACKHICNAMDELVLEHFTDNPVPKTYIKAISDRLQVNINSMHRSDFFYGWARRIMDIPERAKHHYLSDQKAKTLIFAILDAPNELGGVLGIPHPSVPRVIQNLFVRTKPSLEFGHDLRKYLPRLKWVFDKEPVSDYSSVRSILKDCGLENEIRGELGREFI